MKPGDPVRLHCPDNPRLDGALAEIVTLTGYGAEVATEAAGSGKYRALFAEMRPVLEPASVQASQAREQGYTGAICPVCQGTRMRMSGACQMCDDCFTSSGCS